MVTPLSTRAAVAVVLLTVVAGAGLSLHEAASPRAAAASSHAAVATLRIPEGGRLPRAVVDGGGTLHVVYAVGDTSRGDLFHVTREAGAAGWSEPRQVNSRPLSVTGVGPIDGAQLALGPDGRLHVVWLQADPPAFFYTRSRAGGPGFEPQRELPATGHLDGGRAEFLRAPVATAICTFWREGE